MWDYYLSAFLLATDIFQSGGAFILHHRDSIHDFILIIHSSHLLLLAKYWDINQPMEIDACEKSAENIAKGTCLS